MKVVVGVTEYDLKIVDAEVVKDKADGHLSSVDAYAGCIEEFEGKISINKCYPAQTKKQTFWHEVVHAMLAEIGEADLNDDEGFVDAFAKQIYGFIQRNKIDKIYEYLGGRNERTN